MSISTTISQYAQTNPTVAAAVSKQNMDTALLYSAQSGDTQAGGLLSAVDAQQSEVDQLLSAMPESFLGQNIDIKA